MKKLAVWLKAIMPYVLVPMISWAQTSVHLYGIHDHNVGEQEFLNHLNAGQVSGWVTATVEVGDDPNNHSGADFRNISSQGHTVICRINRGYGATGTIPPPALYDNFAQRCAHFVAATQGCDLFIIGNETNLAREWPVVNNYRHYISPQDYATCFRKCYNAIKAVKPTAKVISQALAPFAGPYGAGTIDGVPHDGNPINWVQYLNQMLTAIHSSGGIDGIALHISSRGYTYNDIHSTAKVNANGQQLYFSFYVYKDWVNLGIPSQLYGLPIYATECNGIYYWKGGHPENPSAHYEAGWVQEIYAEINRYNQTAYSQGKPVFRCVNLYRWCSYCDHWNIDGCSYKGQILADLDQAIGFRYSWPGSGGSQPPPSSLQNGTFEGAAQGNGIGEGWQGFATAGYSPTYQVATDQVHGGAKSQKVTCPQPTENYRFAGIYQTISVSPGVSYTISAWNRTSFPGGGAWDFIARMGIDLNGGNNFQAGSVQWHEFDSAKNTWHKLERTVTATGSTLTIFLQGWHKWPTGGSAYAWFDDVVVSRLSQSPPTAVIQAQPTSGQAPLTVNFSGAGSSDPDNDPLTFQWNFGDGSQASGATVQHSYQTAGSYIASLTVSDGHGGSDMATVTITVEPAAGNQNLLTNGTFDSNYNGWQLWSERGTANVTVSNGMLQIQGNNFNGGVYQQFNTGGPGVTIHISGLWQSQPVVANAQWAEVLIINSNRLPVNGQDVNGNQNDVILVYKNDTWATPGGWSGEMMQTSPVAKNPTFTSTGNLATIVLKCGSTTASATGAKFDNLMATIVSNPGTNHPPTARIVTVNKNGLIPLTVSFNGSTSTDPDGDPLSYYWNFGDGSQASGPQQTHTFQNRGSYLVRLTVSDGRGGSHTAQTVVYARRRGTGPIDFDALRQQLNQQGQDLAFVKIGFHVGPGGNRTGIDNYFNSLDAAGVPFALKSVCDGGIIAQCAQMKATSGVPHCLVYRGWHQNGWSGDVPNYNLTPYDAAVLHWQRHMSIFPNELRPYRHLIWIETVNELDKTRAEWIGEFCYHTALIAMAEGFNWAGPSWSTGEPQPQHWQGPWMKKFLTLAAENPERIAVAVHEYSLTRDNLNNMYPYLVGRFQQLFNICDSWGISRPTVLVTEFGWVPDNIANTVHQAMSTDLPWAAELYAQYPQVEGVAIWYLGPGFGNIANQAQQLIAPITDWAQRTYFIIPLNSGNRPPIANFTASPTSGNIPLQVTFNASGSSDPDGDPITCSWDFGDGSQGNGTIVSHTYQQAGTFVARLTVRDSHGLQSFQVRTIQAIDPSAILVWQVIKEEYFDTYNDWYDQGQQQVRNGWILWNDEGHNPLGNPNYTEPWNDWRWPEGTFNWAPHIPEHERPLFLNERGFCYKIFCAYGAWHSKFITPQLQLTPGTYRLRMRYWADIVHHYEGTTKIPPTDPRAFEGKVNLGNMEGDWHYAAYLQDNAVEQVFEVTQSGTYKASFEFRGRWALKHVGAWIKYFLVEKLVQVHIENRPPVPRFRANPSEGIANLTVQFDASLSSDADGDALTYQWDFGDGSQGSGVTVSHTYTTAGVKKVTLTVNDGHNHTRSASRYIQAHPANAAVTWVPVLQEFFNTTSDFYTQGNQQVRNGWTLWNNSGHNPLGNPNGNEPWNDWKTAEAKFRWSDHLSPAEQALFLNEKGFCYRLLAGWSAWNAKLSSPLLNLTPGTYRVRCRFYADVYTDVQANTKIPPQDPLSFEMRCHLGDQEGNWINTNVLGENVIEQVFQINQNGQFVAGFEWRGRWAFRIVAAWVKWLMVERLTAGILVDNGRTGYSQNGSWATATEFGYYDTPSVFSQTPGSTAQWRPNLSQAGLYKIYVRWTANAQRAENALYTITHQNGSQNVRLNQRQSGGQWNELGTYPFVAGQTGYVTLTCESANAPVSADACLFLYSGGSGTTNLVYNFPRSGIYLISVPGQAADMRVSTLFPTAEGGMAMDYVGNDYVPVTILQTGKGYWLNITAAGQVSFTVQPITTFTRQLPALSWNLLGSVITSQPIQSLQVTPPGSGLVLFGYDPLTNSYYLAPSIEPQLGYWAGCIQNCQITVGGGSALSMMADKMTYANAKFAELPPPPDVSRWRKVNTPSQFSIMPNYPNPFNPSTIITFSLPGAEKVEINIYNTLGQCVRHLLLQDKDAGVHQITWDGLDDEGRKASPGVYFYNIRAGKNILTGKMVMVP